MTDDWKRRSVLAGVLGAGGAIAWSGRATGQEPAAGRGLSLLQERWVGIVNHPERATSYSFEEGNQCIATAEAIEGPFYGDRRLPRRSDIREGREGVMLELGLRIVSADTCRPVSGAELEIWHCDAVGLYSRFAKNDPLVWPVPGAKVPPSDEETFLRGCQCTDEQGFARFTTIVPGWYTPRAPHIHGKVWTGGKSVFVFQMYLPDSVNRRVALLPPYNRRPPSPYTNYNDSVIERSGGANGSFLKVTPTLAGYRGTLTVGLPSTAST
ncbi:Dioxygenase [Tsuneonella dongtanensis]|uniref:Dioxygenase n=1 Tax=Tsuneonella dongtanensis TaxID=692370 RepID=A0A1B2ABP7_9SPHN|nr:hypothetical protein [Tsuneonella dongtanensis]ANY19592.1 Dioxygenase [Tsuneonella dongtanensis]